MGSQESKSGKQNRKAKLGTRKRRAYIGGLGEPGPGAYIGRLGEPPGLDYTACPLRKHSKNPIGKPS